MTAIADGICTHDRPILERNDDSVTIVHDDAPSVLRRARGFSPAPLGLPVPSPEPLLATGARLDHTFASATGAHAVVGPRLGDLADAAAYEAFLGALDRVRACTGSNPASSRTTSTPGSSPLDTPWSTFRSADAWASSTTTPISPRVPQSTT